MLTKLGLSNFKPWKRIDGMHLAPITGLFGANSSGKTSILQMLLMLKQTVESPDRAQVLNFGGARTPANLGTFRDVVFGHDEALPLCLELEWNLPDELVIEDPANHSKQLLSGRELRFESEVRYESGRLKVSRLSYTFAKHKFIMEQAPDPEAGYQLKTEGRVFSLKKTRGRPRTTLPPPVKCYGFPDEAKASYRNAGILSDLQLGIENLFAHVYYLGPLREYPARQYPWAGAQPADMGQRGEKTIDALLGARDRGLWVQSGRKHVLVEKYVVSMLDQLGLVSKLNVEAYAKDSNFYQVLVKKAEGAPSVGLEGVGFGVSQVLPALVLCYYVPKGSTIILEQPEIHLHPAVQAGLADVFIDAVQKRNVQIIFESHSEHLLHRLRRRTAEEHVDPAQVALYFCSNQGAESELTALELDLFGNIVNWPEDFFGDEFGELSAITRAAMKRQRGEQDESVRG